MVYNLVIDADSMLYTSCYRNQNTNGEDIVCDIEWAYIDFVGQIYNLKSLLFKQFDLQKTDSIKIEVIFSPKKTFRHDLEPSYKANRKGTAIVGIQELKTIVDTRIGRTLLLGFEADDVVISRAYENTCPNTEVVIACIDKDILLHSPVWCIDYKNFTFHMPKSQEEIELAYFKQAIKGDASDNIKGVKGIGEVGAEKLCNDLFNPMDFDKFVSLFDTEEDALLSMRLVRLDQCKNGKLVLWEGRK